MNQQPMSRTAEIERRTISGYVGLGVGLALLAAAAFFILNVGVRGTAGAADRRRRCSSLGGFVLTRACTCCSRTRRRS